MGKMDGKVAFVTGAARGQGRAHAVAFAREGADVAVLDICAPVESVQYEMPTKHDLDETVRLIEAEGRRAVPIVADVRDWDAMQAAVAQTLEELGRIDVVIANAGILPATGEPSLKMKAWHEAVDILLTGVFHTLKATMTPMIEAGNGGSMIITSSTSGLFAIAFDVEMLNPGEMGYAAAKTGVVGLMRNFAKALGPHGIRVNTVHPMGVRTPMLSGDYFKEIMDRAPAGWCANALGYDLIEPEDVANTMVWLASDDSRAITGSTIACDGGQLVM
ncbi:mycofactocin-coupled SDR family oxidoreductase [Nocardioides caldifontis]|uniref:mycofactocin-coupled SDR family oxidoreductase n=1 Tax=Nocardioides caldifontis TaxID=2588938 RepID=UPI0011DFFF23|nr:mycofactocin-coupled SDR family oxidoreductase [Nocardioides caldifontis]